MSYVYQTLIEKSTTRTWILAAVVCLLIIYCIIPFTCTTCGRITLTEEEPLKTAGYLVDTPNCKIYEMDAWDDSAKKYIFQNVAPKMCPKVFVTVSSQDKIFRFDSSIPEYPSASCCFREIHRVTQNSSKFTSSADSKIRTTECKNIEKSLENPTRAESEFLQIECTFTSKGKNKTIKDYQFILTPPNEQTEVTLNKAKYWETFLKNDNNNNKSESESIVNLDEKQDQEQINLKDKSKRSTNESSQSQSQSQNQLPPSILIIGIDSISRLHMIRSFPKTKSFLNVNDFIEMKGYTKIHEWTFTNLMAALTGKGAFDYDCWHKMRDKTDDCSYIWKNFSRKGYITAFLEDTAHPSNFNSGGKTGFVQKPTDYYLRPGLLAYQQNKGKTMAKDCVGGSIQTDLLIKYIKDFMQEMATKIPYFLLSWFTTIGHDDINGPQTVDSNFRDLLTNAVAKDPENTVIIFMSDHGSRFGAFRETFLGYYEESLPLFFIRMPPSIKRTHPTWYANLCRNSDRLTSPLDLHATLEDILSLANSHSQQRESASDSIQIQLPFIYSHANRQPGFRNIYSFFENTPRNRTCASSKIPEEYCRCGVHPETSKTSTTSTKFGEVVIQNVNKILEVEIKAKTCLSLSFSKFLYLRELNQGEVWNNLGKLIPYKEYLVALEASPSGAHFETKVRLFENETMVVEGVISRINSYDGQNECEKDFKLKYYCVCQEYLDKKKREEEAKKSKKKSKGMPK